MIEMEVELNLNGTRHDCQVLGRCSRNFGGGIVCEVESVRLRDGTSVLGAVAQDDMEALRVRLFAASLAGRVADANEMEAV